MNSFVCLFYRKWFRFDNDKKLAWPRKMSTMDKMFPKRINVPAVFAGHNCWLFSRRDQFVLYIAVLHTVVKNRLSFSFSNAYLIKCLHLLGWDVLCFCYVHFQVILTYFYDLVAFSIQKIGFVKKKILCQSSSEFNQDLFLETVIASCLKTATQCLMCMMRASLPFLDAWQ